VCVLSAYCVLTVNLLLRSVTSAIFVIGNFATVLSRLMIRASRSPRGFRDRDLPRFRLPMAIPAEQLRTRRVWQSLSSDLSCKPSRKVFNMKGLSYVLIAMAYINLHTARVRMCAHGAIPSNGFHIKKVMDYMETMSHQAEFWIEICAAKHNVKSRHGKSIVRWTVLFKQHL
jgi:hypothetical protein